MSKLVKGSFEMMKQLNVAAILKVIRENKNLCRADIAKLTGLTPASVTNITKELINADYLKESKVGESSGGRPPIILEINNDAKYVIGVYIGVGNLEVIISNINAEIIEKQKIVITRENLKYKFVFEKSINLINKVITKSNVTLEQIVGIGVAMHGVVNSKDGISIYAPYYDWHNVDIKNELQKEFNLPVYVDNDVRAMAIGESLFGIAKNISNFIIINISDGIGAGIIIDNKPYCGINFSSGEIGHIVVVSDGSKCSCGNYGCLETVASNESIARKAIKLIKEGCPSTLSKLHNDLDEITIKDICYGANNDDELCINIIKEASRYIGLAITNLINILNPQSIVVVGEIIENIPLCIDTIKNTVKKRGFKIPTNSISIVRTKLGSNAAVIGAATLVIEEVFNGNI